MLIDVAKWTNDNQGVVSLLIFLATICIAWITGLFSAMRRRPKLRLTLLEGPTLCSTFLTGNKHNGFDAHQTGIALYLKISNVGSAPTSIEAIKLGYRWHLRPWTLYWFRYRVLWFWLQNPAIAIEDFQVAIGENIKFYPFLLQRSAISGEAADNYLRVGQSMNGVIYFEQPESWEVFFHRQKMDELKYELLLSMLLEAVIRKLFRFLLFRLMKPESIIPLSGLQLLLLIVVLGHYRASL
jgi:hypothetical protein